MKKINYIKPCAEIIELKECDVVTLSAFSVGTAGTATGHINTAVAGDEVKLVE